LLNERIAELEQEAASRLVTLRQMSDVVDKLEALSDRMEQLERGNGNGEPRTA
jgi:hypothetical protein